MDPVIWNAGIAPTVEGWIPVRVNNRYLRFLVTLRGGFDHAVGLEVYGEPTSGR